MVRSRIARIVLLVIGAMFLCSCTGGTQNSTTTKIAIASTPESISLDFDEILASGGAENQPDAVIPDEKIAVKIANIIMGEAIGLDLSEFEITKVYYDHSKELWVVSYQIHEWTLGGDVNIALSKKTGETVLIWSGE